MDGCQYLAKIGTNLDGALPHRYIGFVYAKKADLAKVISLAKNFPYAELIDNLDEDGIQTSVSMITVLTKNQLDEVLTA